MALTKITSTNIGSNAVANSIGYTPVNKGGDSMSGNLTLNYSNPRLIFTDTGTSRSINIGHWDGTNNRIELSGANTLFAQYGSNSIRFTNQTSGGEFAMDSSGRVTKPNQPSCQLSRSADFTTTGSTVLWDVISHNTGSHYNSSTGVFTAPIAGKYLIGLMVMTNGTTATMDIAVVVNGNTNDNRLVPYQSSGASYNQASGSSVFNLAASDTISVRLNSGTVYGGSGRHCSFYIHFLG